MLSKWLATLAVSFGIAIGANAAKAESTLDYIHTSWKTLTRSHATLLAATEDPKLAPPLNKSHLLYIPFDENFEEIRKTLQSNMSAKDFLALKIKRLPKDVRQAKAPGLLYLPHPYVVPGGRFNEMYGWDSYFIVLGLLHDNQVQLAKDMTDNLLYEVKHYGTVLNANRSYYLERSQPPLLSEMVLAVYERTQDNAWLAKAVPLLEKFYRYWTTGPRLDKTTGLSCYYADGEGPAFEVVHSQNPVERMYYEKVKAFFKAHPHGNSQYQAYYDAKHDRLTPAFYKADRTIRESGFDLTSKYGPFGIYITRLVPVSLNSMLVQMENDMATLSSIVAEEHAVEVWTARAKKRAKLLNAYLYSPSLGYYFDYNVQTHQRSPYIFATTYFPLWAGVASKAQAARVVANGKVLLTSAGVVTSPYNTGAQWDMPFVWAPMQWIAVLGLEHYGYTSQAKVIAKNFTETVQVNFKKSGGIYEKYNVNARMNNQTHDVMYGYHSNEVGFGWTNAVYLRLLPYVKGSG